MNNYFPKFHRAINFLLLAVFSLSIATSLIYYSASINSRDYGAQLYQFATASSLSPVVLIVIACFVNALIQPQQEEKPSGNGISLIEWSSILFLLGLMAVIILNNAALSSVNKHLAISKEGTEKINQCIIDEIEKSYNPTGYSLIFSSPTYKSMIKNCK